MVGWIMRTRLFASNALLSILVVASGCCFSSFNPVQPPPPDVIARCEGLNHSCLEHVHVVVINGFDPSQITNAVGLAHYLETSGFPHIYYSTQWASYKYLERIREIKAADPSARIAVIGYSMGVCCARKLAQRSKEQGITVDLLVYMDAFAANHSPEHAATDAKRIVNIITVPRLGIFGSEPLAGAQNYQFLDVRHVNVPTDSLIVQRVLEELVALTSAGEMPNSGRATE
jgi:hypothetical protein